MAGLSFDRGTRPIAPDGTRAAVRTATGTLVLLDLEHGDRRPLGVLAAGERVLAWSTDGTSLLVVRLGEPRAWIDRIDVATGVRSHHFELVPPDPAGTVAIDGAVLDPETGALAFSYRRSISTLYRVDWPATSK